mmetsp:Transcript_8752/g.16945  ORF Transcript_8752/g.16945 Transcript_8752/m.16945 type:complete len:205 (-) Transcript_8752:178-792(-)
MVHPSEAHESSTCRVVNSICNAVGVGVGAGVGGKLGRVLVGRGVGSGEGASTGAREGPGVGVEVGGHVASVFTTTRVARALNSSQKYVPPPLDTYVKFTRRWLPRCLLWAVTSNGVEMHEPPAAAVPEQAFTGLHVVTRVSSTNTWASSWLVKSPHTFSTERWTETGSSALERSNSNEIGLDEEPPNTSLSKTRVSVHPFARRG